MKKILLSTFLGLGFTMLFAQDQTSVADWNPELYRVNKKYPGYVITMDGDTVKGFIKAGKRCSTGGIGASNQNRCEFYSKEGDKKPAAKYKPADIKGYMIADKLYESIKYSGGLTKKPNFNIVVIEGAIRRYEWYSTVENYATLRMQSGETYSEYDARRFETNIILAKGGQNPIAHSSMLLKFSKKMAELVADNSELATKVTNKEKGYKMLSMFKIIDEYNDWASKQ